MVKLKQNLSRSVLFLAGIVLSSALLVGFAQSVQNRPGHNNAVRYGGTLQGGTSISGTLPGTNPAAGFKGKLLPGGTGNALTGTGMGTGIGIGTGNAFTGMGIGTGSAFTGTGTGNVLSGTNKNATIQGQLMLFDGKKADSIRKQLEAMPDVKSAQVIVRGNTALVGCKPSKTSIDVNSLAGKVSDKVKSLDKSVTNVCVTDKDSAMNDMTKLSNDIKSSGSNGNAKTVNDCVSRFNRLLQVAKPAGK